MAVKRQRKIRCLADTDCQGTIEVRYMTYPLKVGKKTIVAVNHSVICCSVLPVASLYGRLSLAARGHGVGRGATESPPYSAFTTDHV
jgi:hypothetical protein